MVVSLFLFFKIVMSAECTSVHLRCRLKMESRGVGAKELLEELEEELWNLEELEEEARERGGGRWRPG